MECTEWEVCPISDLEVPERVLSIDDDPFHPVNTPSYTDVICVIINISSVPFAIVYHWLIVEHSLVAGMRAILKPWAGCNRPCSLLPLPLCKILPIEVVSACVLQYGMADSHLGVIQGLFS